MMVAVIPRFYNSNSDVVRMVVAVAISMAFLTTIPTTTAIASTTTAMTAAINSMHSDTTVFTERISAGGEFNEFVTRKSGETVREELRGVPFAVRWRGGDDGTDDENARLDRLVAEYIQGVSTDDDDDNPDGIGIDDDASVHTSDKEETNAGNSETEPLPIPVASLSATAASTSTSSKAVKKKVPKRKQKKKKIDAIIISSVKTTESKVSSSSPHLQAPSSSPPPPIQHQETKQEKTKMKAKDTKMKAKDTKNKKRKRLTKKQKTKIPQSSLDKPTANLVKETESANSRTESKNNEILSAVSASTSVSTPSNEEKKRAEEAAVLPRSQTQTPVQTQSSTPVPTSVNEARVRIHAPPEAAYPNAVYRYLLRRGTSTISHTLVMTMIGISSWLQMYLPEFYKLLLYVLRKLHLYDPSKQRLPQSRAPGFGRNQPGQQQMNDLYAGVVDTDRSQKGSRNKKVRKLQVQQQDADALRKWGLLKPKDSTLDVKYAYLSTSFMKRYGVGKFAAVAREQQKIHMNSMSPQAGTLTSLQMQENPSPQELLEDELPSSRLAKDIIAESTFIASKIHDTAENGVDENDGDVDSEDDISWILDAFGDASSPRKSQTATREDGFDNEYTGWDSFLDEDEDEIPLAERLDFVDALTASFKNTKTSKSLTSKSSSSSLSATFELLKSTTTGSSKRILGGYPNDALPIEQAGNPYGLIGVATKKYGYGDWSSTDEGLLNGENDDDRNGAFFRDLDSAGDTRSSSSKRKKRRKRSPPIWKNDEVNNDNETYGGGSGDDIRINASSYAPKSSAPFTNSATLGLSLSKQQVSTEIPLSSSSSRLRRQKQRRKTTPSSVARKTRSPLGQTKKEISSLAATVTNSISTAATNIISDAKQRRRLTTAERIKALKSENIINHRSATTQQQKQHSSLMKKSRPQRNDKEKDFFRNVAATLAASKDKKFND